MHSGTTIAHYEVGKRLGEGGMGVVYRARDTRLDRTVALKFLSRHLLEDDEAKERFVREARAASALDHPNICTIHDIAETDDGDLYIVMAHYEGATLRKRMEREEFPADRVVSLIGQLARALKRAHEAGIIHRDLKPANIMVSDDDQVRLLDFGVAKLMTAPHLTRTGSTVGTVGYMSPEQARGDEVSAALDVWALGVIAYELLAGTPPFHAPSQPAVLYKIIYEDPPPLGSLKPDLPGSLTALVHAALAKDPRDRIPDGSAFLQALEAATDASPVTPDRRRGWRTLSLIALATLVAAGVVVIGRAALEGPAQPAASGVATASPDVIAVMPFAVRGAPDLEYLGEGLVDLISDKLDGAGTLRSIDPRSVIGTAKRADLDPGDPLGAAAVARTLGADRFITGEVTALGDQVSLRGALRDVGAGVDPIETASAEGSPDELLTLIDELSTRLLAGSLSGPNARLQEVATRTSASLDAIKEFLRGEQLHREGLYREAAMAYNAALKLDSTFALAHYKKSFVNDFTEEPDDYRAAEAALRHSGDLSTRDRALVQALRDKRFGLHERAEQAYRAHVLRYPDEVGALVQLGEILFHANPRRGRPMGEAREWFERVLDVEPGNIEARLHLARLDAAEGNLEGLRRHGDFFERVVPDSERSIEVSASYAFAAGDTARQREVTERLQVWPWWAYAYAASAAVRYAPASASAMLATRPAGYDYLDAMVPQLHMATGRYEAVRAFIRDPARERNSTWHVLDATMIQAGLFEIERETIETVLERVRAIDPPDLVRTSFLPFHDVVGPDATAFARDWHVANLLALLGRFEEAWAIQRRLEDADDFLAMGSLRADRAASLEAMILYRSGDREAALEVLRGLRYDQTSTMIALAFGDGTLGRFLRAELEMEIGTPALARPFYEGFLGSYSHHDRMLTAISFRRLAELAELEGDGRTAATHYARFLDAWKEADPELTPEREATEKRLQALIDQAS